MTSSQFEQAATYTLDKGMKGILYDCSIGKYPLQFKMVRNAIHTTKGNRYDIPSDPIDLMNLVYDIMHGQEAIKKIITNTPSSRVISGCPNITNDAIHCYAYMQSRNLGRDDLYAGKLYSCIYGALFVGRLSMDDIHMKDDIIISIDRLDPSVPCLLDK